MPLLSRNKFLLVAVVAVLLAPVILSGRVRHSLITHWPIKGPYLKYSQWRYKWGSPSDVGSGENAMQIIIEGPMGIGEDHEGNISVQIEMEADLECRKSRQAIVMAGLRNRCCRWIPPEIAPAREFDLESRRACACLELGFCLGIV